MTTLRLTTDADATTLRDLALLDSARPLTGPVVLAELGGRAVAARSLADGRVVADPFVPTAAVLELLETYAARAATAPRRSAWSLPPQRRHLQAAA